MPTRILFFFLLAVATTVNAKMPAPGDTTTPYILTPAAGPVPRINGPAVFGVRPNHPILFTIPATGARPISFTADNLPARAHLDKSTGHLSCSVATPGEYVITLRARHTSGRTDR